MGPEPYRITMSRKIVQLVVVFVILVSIWRVSSFKVAVLAALAMNSADLNETREKLANLKSNLESE